MNVTACKCARGCTNEDGGVRGGAWLHPRRQSRVCMRVAAARAVTARVPLATSWGRSMWPELWLLSVAISYELWRQGVVMSQELWLL